MQVGLMRILFYSGKIIGYDSNKVKQLLGSSPITPKSRSARVLEGFPDDFYTMQASLSGAGCEQGENVQSLPKLYALFPPIYGRFLGHLGGIDGVS